MGTTLKAFIEAIWEIHKQKLYGADSCQPRPSAGDQEPVVGVVGRVSKLGKSGHSQGMLHECDECDISVPYSVCGSAHSCGCVVDGSIARAAY